MHANLSTASSFVCGQAEALLGGSGAICQKSSVITHGVSYLRALGEQSDFRYSVGHSLDQVRRIARRELALVVRRQLPGQSARRSWKRPGKKGGQNECVAPNPCGHGKSGVKKSVLVHLTPLLRIEGSGWPLAVCTSGANTPDAKLLALTLVRYDKLADRYLAMVKLATAMLWFRRWHTLLQKDLQKPSLLK